MNTELIRRLLLVLMVVFVAGTRALSDDRSVTIYVKGLADKPERRDALQQALTRFRNPDEVEIILMSTDKAGTKKDNHPDGVTFKYNKAAVKIERAAIVDENRELDDKTKLSITSLFRIVVFTTIACNACSNAKSEARLLTERYPDLAAPIYIPVNKMGTAEALLYMQVTGKKEYKDCRFPLFIVGGQQHLHSEQQEPCDRTSTAAEKGWEKEFKACVERSLYQWGYRRRSFR